MKEERRRRLAQGRPPQPAQPPGTPAQPDGLRAFDYDDVDKAYECTSNILAQQCQRLPNLRATNNWDRRIDGRGTEVDNSSATEEDARSPCFDSTDDEWSDGEEDFLERDFRRSEEAWREASEKEWEERRATNPQPPPEIEGLQRTFGKIEAAVREARSGPQPKLDPIPEDGLPCAPPKEMRWGGKS